MAKSVFYSFQYEPDNWRVQKVIQMGAVTGGTAFTAQDWEQVRLQSDAAIEKWIHDQMKYTKAVIVLVGETTANSRWVDYEIRKAWDDGRPLLGVRIHGLSNNKGETSAAGANPFSNIRLKDGTYLDQRVRLIDPMGSDSQSVYNDIANNLETWVEIYATSRS